MYTVRDGAGREGRESILCRARAYITYVIGISPKVPNIRRCGVTAGIYFRLVSDGRARDYGAPVRMCSARARARNRRRRNMLARDTGRRHRANERRNKIGPTSFDWCEKGRPKQARGKDVWFGISDRIGDALERRNRRRIGAEAFRSRFA